jgi:hypothetical protein
MFGEVDGSRRWAGIGCAAAIAQLRSGTHDDGRAAGASAISA